jgi:hypothetical protein
LPSPFHNANATTALTSVAMLLIANQKPGLKTWPVCGYYFFYGEKKINAKNA